MWNAAMLCCFRVPLPHSPPPYCFGAILRRGGSYMTERYTTTDGGAPAPSDEQSLTVGPDGPILLQDHYLIEQMAQFNRERIPERQPHAKGGGAFGHFEATNDVSKYTRAAVFQ